MRGPAQEFRRAGAKNDRMHRARPFVLIASAIAACAAIAGCGGSSTAFRQTPTVTVVHTRTVTDASAQPSETVTAPSGATATTHGKTVTTSVTPATGTSTTGGVGVGGGGATAAGKPLGRACTASDLTPSYLGSNGAAGTIELGFALQNTGSTTCHTYGWPGVEFISAGGSALPTNATRSSSDPQGSTPPTLLNIDPGQVASFRVIAGDFTDSGGSCPSAGALQIYAPDDTVTMRVALPAVPACGRTTVSPMMPGTSAYNGQ